MATTYDIRYTAWDRAQQAVWYLLYLVEGLLALRFVLRLIGANAAAPFTDFIYRITQPLMTPFTSIVRSTRISGAAGTIEWSTLIGIAVYALIAWALVRLFEIADADTEHVIDYSVDDGYEPGITTTPSGPAYYEDDQEAYPDYRLRHRSPRV